VKEPGSLGAGEPFVVSHQLRGRVPRKEAGALSWNQQRISCNFIKMEQTLGYFTLSFE